MPAGGERDDDELRRVFREHVDGVHAFFAYAVARDVAEDLTSATFERVVRSWRSYDARKASERTWILTIARNLLTDHYRRASHRAWTSLDEQPALLDALAGTSDPLAEQLELDAVRRWLAPLGAREREILALRYGADMTPADIGTLLELTTANVHQIISRSLRKLREGAPAEAES